MDRYHQVLEPVPPGDVRDALEIVGTRLAVCLDVVHRRCAEAHQAAPSGGLDVPAGADGAAGELHRRLSSAAALVAQAAEAATMARVELRAGRDRDAAARADAAQRVAVAVERLVS